MGKYKEYASQWQKGNRHHLKCYRALRTTIRKSDIEFNQVIESLKNNITPDSMIDHAEWQDTIMLKDDVHKIISTLSARQQEIIRLRFGFDDTGMEKSYSDVARILGVSRQCVFDLEKSAMNRLRKFSSINKVKDYV